MKQVFFFLFSLGFAWSSQAQKITRINYTGLKKTKVSYLQQFVVTQVGDKLDSTLLETDRQVLTNLEILSNVNYSVVETGKQEFEVEFQCEELFSLLPIFSFGGIEENFWVQAGVSEVNLTGRGHKLVTYYQHYDRSSYAAHLFIDRINQSNWGVNLNFIKWGTLEPLFFPEGSIEYNYDNYTFGISGIYHIDFQRRIEFGGAYFTENYESTSPSVFEGAPNELTTNKLLNKLIYYQNQVDYHYFYLDGVGLQWNLENVQSLDGDFPFYISFIDFKSYLWNKKKSNTAARLRVGLSTNRANPFAPFVLDSYVNIRGVGNRVDRGTGAIVLNVEHRQTIYETTRHAIQLVGFIDFGTWRQPGGTFSDFTMTDNFISYSGPGVRFIHKKIYNAIFRLDYGFNLRNSYQNGIVIGIGQYF